MTTSGSTNYTDTRANIIEDALSAINVQGAEEQIDSSDSQLINRKLNRLIKAWQALGLHLWKKQTATLFLQKSQYNYILSSTSSDHATLSYLETTLAANATAGATSVTVTTDGGIAVNDYIGIVLDNNTMFWTQVTNISGTPVISFSPTTLTSAASAGNKVYTYTTKLDEPFNILSMNRNSPSNIDVPMNYLSYEEYFELPNKTSESIPVSYNYDRQLGEAKINIWPVPSNVNYKIKFTLTQKIEDFDTNANTPDFPQEWYDALVVNLAVKIAPHFGKNTGNSFANLKADAVEALELAKSFDNEQGSVFIQVGRKWR